MAKVKLTKGELKKQRDSLRRYERYLPILQLKKQQLQMEILKGLHLLAEKKELQAKRIDAVDAWAGLLAEPEVDLKPWLKPLEIFRDTKNIAGVEVPVFKSVRFADADYDLFATPMWMDAALEALQALVSLREEISVLERGIEILRHELRITTQRVNLFEKVKIPETREAIRIIKIYLGDQMANAVGHSKIAKSKIEAAL